MRQRLVPLLLPAFGALLLFGTAVSGPQAGAADAEPADVSLCADCHESEAKAFSRTPHSQLASPEFSSGGLAAGSCNYCHAGAAEHIDQGGGVGTIFAFASSESFRARVDVCLTCHGDVHPRFMSTPHAAAGIDCTSCHTVHGTSGGTAQLKLTDHVNIGMERVDVASASCRQCHEDVFTQFQFNERHRLQEGILSCTSCHNPHEPQARVALGGFKQQACTECHGDKEGPFVFEHGSQKVEGCVACHTPHGSPNRHMLNFQSTAELCYSCHAVVPSFHSRFTLDTACTNCHSSIHGSNFDPFFLK